MKRRWTGLLGSALTGVCVGCGSPSPPGIEPGSATADGIVGSWQGSSKCVNLTLAPSCKDDTVVFDVKKAETEGAVTFTGDRIVDGKRESMGRSLEFKYDAGAGCWRTEFETPRMHGAWCLKVQGDALTGAFSQIPGGAIREVQLKRQS